MMYFYFCIICFLINISVFANEFNPFVKKENDKKEKKSIALKNLKSVSADHFQVVVDDKYIDDMIALADKRMYEDDIIKVIQNAKKVRNKKKTIKIVNVEDEIIPDFYYLRSAVKIAGEKHWFAVVNDKLYSNGKINKNHKFFVETVADRYAVIHFKNITQVDIDNINNNKNKKIKYSENIKLSSKKDYFEVKIFVGQTYDRNHQRIYDGFLDADNLNTKNIQDKIDISR